jgi:phosphonatase-like hydrolase
MTFELVVTDFAGTVMQDDGAVLAAYRQAFAEHDVSVSEDDLAARRGASKRAVFHELVGRGRPASEAVSATAERALARFESLLTEQYTTGPVQEVPGAEAAIRALRASGLKIALSSGFNRSLVAVLVQRLGWTELFDLVLSSDDTPAGRPAPYLIYKAMIDLRVFDVRRVVVVGDTPLDMEAGMNARAGWVVGVLSGAHGLETLGATPHTHLLPSIAALPALLPRA